MAFGEIHPDYYNVSDEIIAEVDKEVDDIIEAKRQYLKDKEAERERIRAEKARRREERLKAEAEAAAAAAQAEENAAGEEVAASEEVSMSVENVVPEMENQVSFLLKPLIIMSKQKKLLLMIHLLKIPRLQNLKMLPQRLPQLLKIAMVKINQSILIMAKNVFAAENFLHLKKSSKF